MLRGLDGYLLIPLFCGWPTLRFSSSGVERRGRLSHHRGVMASRRRSLTLFGGHSEGETPLPIPNRAVKPLRADGTWPSRAWESRSPPNYFLTFRAVPRGGPSSF